MSAGGSTGMVLDRALDVRLLDVALRIATQHGDDTEARRLLAVALRDVVSAQEAGNKTKKVLTRVWVAPPTEAHAMVRWGVAHQDECPERRVLHYGALLATFPFFGAMAAAVGRQLHLEGVADRKALREFARSTFGHRETIDAGAAKSLATMRNLGLLDGPVSGPFTPAQPMVVPPSFAGWYLHALALTRRTRSVRVGLQTRAFEMFAVDVSASVAGYPLLDIHTQGDGAVAETVTDAQGSTAST